MAAVQTVITRIHETWAEAVPQNGGVSQNLLTNIVYAAVEAPFVDIVLQLVAAVGVPAMQVSYTAVGNRLQVTVSNAAAPGNTATWNLDVRNNHTICR